MHNIGISGDGWWQSYLRSLAVYHNANGLNYFKYGLPRDSELFIRSASQACRFDFLWILIITDHCDGMIVPLQSWDDKRQWMLTKLIHIKQQQYEYIQLTKHLKSKITIKKLNQNTFFFAHGFWLVGGENFGMLYRERQNRCCVMCKIW